MPYTLEDVKKKIRADLESGDPAREQGALEMQRQIHAFEGASDLGRGLARTGKNAVQGIVEVADIAAYPIRKGYELVTGDQDWEPYAPQIGKTIDEWTGNYTVPQSKGEQLYDTTVRSVSTVPGLGLAAKGLGTVAKGAKALGLVPQGMGTAAKGVKGTKAAKMLQDFTKLNAQNLGGAAGAGVASEYARQELPENPYIPIVAGLVGGLSGGAAGHAVAKPLRINHKALKAFQEAGIPYGLADVSRSKAIHQLKDSLPRTWGAQTLMDGYIGSQIHAVNKGLGNLSSYTPVHGTSESLAVKGASQKLKNEHVKFSRRYGKNEENLKRIANEQVPLTHVQRWLEELHPDVRRDLETRPSKVRSYLKELLGDAAEAVDYDKPLSEILSQWESGSPAKSVPFLKRKGSQMGEDIRAADAYGNVKEGELKHLSGLLKKDIEAAIAPQMKALGEEAYQNWKTVGGLYSEFRQQEVPHLNKILNEALYDPKTQTYSASGKETDILKVLQKDLGKNGNVLATILEGLPSSERKALSKSLFKDLGMRQGEFSSHVLDTNFRKLPEPSQKLLLRSLGPEDRKQFLSTLAALRQIKQVLKEANHAKSAHHLGAYQEMKDYAAIASDLASKSESGHKRIFRKGAETLGKNIAARLITSPKVADFVAKVGGKGPKRVHPGRSLLQSEVLNQILNDHGGPRKRKASPSVGMAHRKQGGSVRQDPMLQKVLKETAAKGRYGDTRLAEINPKTASILDQLIHEGHKHVNPKTGLREYGKSRYWRKGFGLGTNPQVKYQNLKNEMPALKVAAMSFPDRPGEWCSSPNAMAQFLDKKHEKTLAKLDYYKENEAARHALPPGYLDKLKWKVRDSKGRNEHRVSRAAKQAMRNTLRENPLLDLHEMFSGKKDFYPATMTDMSRETMRPRAGQTTLIHNIAGMQAEANAMRGLHPNAVSAIFPDENTISGSKLEGGHLPNYRYYRPDISPAQLKEKIRQASLNSNSLLSGNANTIERIPAGQEAQYKAAHNSAVGNQPRYTKTFNPTDYMQNSTYASYNGVPLFEHHKKNPFKEASDDDMTRQIVFKPGEGEIIPDSMLSAPTKNYIKNKFGHTTCMEANYRTDQDTVRNREPYPKTALSVLASDYVAKGLTGDNAQILNQANVRKIPPLFRLQYYGGFPQDLNADTVARETAFGSPNKGVRIDSSSLNNRYINRTPTARLNTNDVVTPFLKHAHAKNVIKVPVISNTQNITGGRQLGFVKPQAPMRFDPGYGSRVIPTSGHI